MFVIPHLILKKGDKILLTKRASTQKIWPNHWHCVTGTIEPGESPQEAIIRETKEEIGITLFVPPKLATVIYVDEESVLHPGKRFNATELFFESELQEGQIPINMEPHKQDEIGWFDISSLPQPMIPCVEYGLRIHQHSIDYSEYKR